jgi:hypothetical protein
MTVLATTGSNLPVPTDWTDAVWMELAQDHVKWQALLLESWSLRVPLL